MIGISFWREVAEGKPALTLLQVANQVTVDSKGTQKICIM